MSATVVPFDRRRRRLRNYTGSEDCRACSDSALVVAEHRPGGSPNKPVQIEIYGPCPFCERGFRLEFGLGKDRNGGELTGPGVWGEDGYWKGRELPPGLEELAGGPCRYVGGGAGE